MHAQKIFGIGLNKTGTTTLGDMLGQLGFRHKTWTPWLFALQQRGDLPELFAQTEDHDSFTDWPWPLIVAPLLDHFGDGARFILTRRSDAQTWLNSLKGHALATHPGNNARLSVYGYEYPHENEAAHLRLYADHLDETRQLFFDNHAEHLLLEVCWETGDGWKDIAGFLDRDAPCHAIPHHNSRKRRRTFLPNKAANLARITQLGAP